MKTSYIWGGLAEPDERDLPIGLHNYEPIREMYERCLEFLPVLRGATIDIIEPVRVVLRPIRFQNVRLACVLLRHRLCGIAARHDTLKRIT